jgi:hypothetical protein
MDVMRRAGRVVALGVILAASLCPCVSAEDGPRPERRFANPLLDTVVRMTRAEVPTRTILAYLRVRRVLLQSDVETPDLVRLRKEGVDEEIVRYVAQQSRLDVPPAPADEHPAKGDGDASEPESPNGDAGSGPAEPDPGDTGLIMGVYDPIPTGGYPCWPAWLAPYGCGDRAIVVWQGGGGPAHEARAPERAGNRERTVENGERPSPKGSPPSGGGRTSSRPRR